MRDFFGCYLLLSLAPHIKGKTYIGFTVNPRRRIRQHNGLITAGARKTSSGRPWEMALVLYGFPTKIQALQFEWAWQHPMRSVIVKPIAQALGSKRLLGIRGKILLMLSMLHQSPWRHFPLTLQYLDPKYAAMVKETVASAPCHVRVFTAPMDDLPRTLDDLDDEDDDEDGDEKEDARAMQGGRQEPWKRGEGSKDRRQRCTAGKNGAQKDGPDGEDCSSSSSGGGDAGSCGPSDSEISGGEPLELLQQAAYNLDRGASREGESQRDNGAAPTGATAAIAATAPGGGSGGGGISRLPCQICQGVIQRHILVCSTCSVAFHLDCLAACWSAMEAAAAGGRFGGVPEQGRCPACDTLHSWMALLRSMQTVGWVNRPQGRRGRGLKKAFVVGEAPAGESRRKGKGTAGEAGAATLGLPPCKPYKRSAKAKAAQIDAAAGDLQPQEWNVAEAAAPDGTHFETHQHQQHHHHQSNQEEKRAPAAAAKQGRKPQDAKRHRPAARSDGVSAIHLDVNSGTGDPLLGPGQEQGDNEGLCMVTKAPYGRLQGPKPRARKHKLAMQPANSTQAPITNEVALCGDLAHWAASSLEPMESPSKRQQPARRLRELGTLQPLEVHDPQTQSGYEPTATSGAMPHASIGHVAWPPEPSPLPLWQRLRARAAPAAAGGATCIAKLGAADTVQEGTSAPLAGTAGSLPQNVTVLASDSSESEAEGRPMKGHAFEETEVEVKGEGGFKWKLARGQRGTVLGSYRSGKARQRQQHISVDTAIASHCTTELQDTWEAAAEAWPHHPQQKEQQQEQQRRRRNSLPKEASPSVCIAGPEQSLPDIVILGTTSESTDPEDLEPDFGGFVHSFPRVGLCRSPEQNPRQATCVAAPAAVHVPAPATHTLPAPMEMGMSMQRHNVPVAEAVAMAFLGFSPVPGFAGSAIDGSAFDSPIVIAPSSGVTAQGGTGSSYGSPAGFGASGGLAVIFSQLQCAQSTSPQSGKGIAAAADGPSSFPGEAARSAPTPRGAAVVALCYDTPVLAGTRGEEQNGNPTLTPARHRQQLLARDEPLDKEPNCSSGRGHMYGSEVAVGHGQDMARLRSERLPVREVVDLCTPLPLHTRVARRAVATQAAVAAGPGEVSAAKRLGHAAGKRLRSPKPPPELPALGTCNRSVYVNSDPSDSMPGGVHGGKLTAHVALAAAVPAISPTCRKETERIVPSSAIEGCKGSSSHAHVAVYGERASGGWSISPWPLRQRRGSPVPAVIQGGGLGSDGRLEDSNGRFGGRLNLCPDVHDV